MAHDDARHGIFLDVALGLLLDEQLGYGTVWVRRVQVELVLVAVHRVDDDALRVIGGLDARHVAIGLHRNL